MNAETQTPAGHLRRLTAFVIDNTFFYIVFLSGFYLGYKPFAPASSASSEDIDLSRLTVFIVPMILGLSLGALTYWIANGWFYQRYGGGPGKLLLGLYVSDIRTHKTLSWNQAAFRESVAKFLSAIPLGGGYLMGFFRDDKRMLHDFLSHSRVENRISPLSSKRKLLGVLALIVVGYLAFDQISQSLRDIQKWDESTKGWEIRP